MMKRLLTTILLASFLSSSGQALDLEFLSRTVGEMIANPGSEEFRSFALEIKNANDSLAAQYDPVLDWCRRQCLIVTVDKDEVLVDWTPLSIDSLAFLVCSFLINEENEFMQLEKLQWSFPVGNDVYLSRSRVEFLVKNDLNELEVLALREIAKGVSSYRDFIIGSAYGSNAQNLSESQLNRVNSLAIRYLNVDTYLPPPPPPPEYINE